MESNNTASNSTSDDNFWRGAMVETLEDEVIAIAYETWEITDGPAYSAAIEAAEARHKREQSSSSKYDLASIKGEAAVAEADQAVVTGFALAMTVAERANGLDAWMAAALKVPGTPGAPTRTPMQLGSH